MKTDIAIASHFSAVPFLEKNKGYNAVILTNAGVPYPRFLKTLSADLIHKEFDDIEFELAEEDAASWRLPKKEDIEDILKWAEGKEKLLCACHAGRSRSSACAYLILCSRMKPSEAITVLNPDRHSPNQLIVKYGAEILNNPKIVEEFKDWTRSFGKREWLF